MTYIIAHCVLCGDTLLLEKGRDDNLIYPPVCRDCWEGCMNSTTDYRVSLDDCVSKTTYSTAWTRISSGPRYLGVREWVGLFWSHVLPSKPLRFSCDISWQNGMVYVDGEELK